MKKTACLVRSLFNRCYGFCSFWPIGFLEKFCYYSCYTATLFPKASRICYSIQLRIVLRHKGLWDLDLAKHLSIPVFCFEVAANSDTVNILMKLIFLCTKIIFVWNAFKDQSIITQNCLQKFFSTEKNHYVYSYYLR